MKKLIPIILVLCMLLCSCSGGTETETTQQESTSNNETVKPVVHRNPLNGEILDAPFSGRVFSVSINNVSPALPHRGVGDADVFFEMLVNDYCTRGLALYSDVASVPSIGSIRSTRYNFTDISKAYNSVMVYSGGSGVVLSDMENVGIDSIVAEVPVGYRDSSRSAAGYASEHTLFATGKALYDAAVEKGYNVDISDKDYGMTFSEEGTPKDGSAAKEIEISFTLSGKTKKTVMKYDAEKDEYIYNQYGKEMIDENTGEAESFKNVIVMHTEMLDDPVYHVADLFAMGTGYYACGGKIIPIKWWIRSPEHAFTFLLESGQPLVQEVGSTYIAIAPVGSAVVCSQ